MGGCYDTATHFSGAPVYFLFKFVDLKSLILKYLNNILKLCPNRITLWSHSKNTETQNR